MHRLLISIVTYNSEEYISRCLCALLDQSNLNFSIIIIDNGSTDRTLNLIREFKNKANDRILVEMQELPVNLGFCGGHNRSTKSFLDNMNYEWILYLNPDLRLSADAIDQFFKIISNNPAQIITPKLFRADIDLQPVDPKLLDAAGMVLTKELRHFDRGSNSIDIYPLEHEIFGGTGACLFIKRNAIKNLILKSDLYDEDVYKVYPDLEYEPQKRSQLFDEAFFAYREDADLCWRANLQGIQTLFAPSIIGFHRRVVLPSNRSKLSSRLNGLSVRNRFLLQINNYFFVNSIGSLILGLIFRNLIVILGVLFFEFRSIPYLFNLFRLIPRALERRAILRSKIEKLSRII